MITMRCRRHDVWDCAICFPKDTPKPREITPQELEDQLERTRIKLENVTHALRKYVLGFCDCHEGHCCHNCRHSAEVERIINEA